MRPRRPDSKPYPACEGPRSELPNPCSHPGCSPLRADHDVTGHAGEAAALRRLCDAGGSTPSETIRTMLVAADAARAEDGRGIPVIVLDRMTFAQYLRCVRGLGTLLNQSNSP